MDCRHDIKNLLGTADGIVCRRCGKVFASFAQIEAEGGLVSEQEKPVEKTEAPKKARKKKDD